MIAIAVLVSLLLVAAPEGPAPGSAGQSAPAAAAIDPALVGEYRLEAGPDTASGLLLAADGRFAFFLIEGAADFRAEGRWTSAANVVTLNTDPRPTPPAFSPGPVGRDPEAPVTVKLNWPDGSGIALIDVRLGLADGRVIEGYTQEEGWTPHESDLQYENGVMGAIVPAWVELSLVWQGIAPARFDLDPNAGNVFAFTLTPNDLGVVDFRDSRLDVTDRGLVPQADPNVVYARE